MLSEGFLLLFLHRSSESIFHRKGLEMGIRDNLSFPLSLTESPKANPNNCTHKVKPVQFYLKSISVTVTPLLTRLTPLKPSHSFSRTTSNTSDLLSFQLFLKLKNIFFSLLYFSLFGLISMRTPY